VEKITLLPTSAFSSALNEEFAQFIEAALGVWGRVIRTVNIKPQ